MAQPTADDDERVRSLSDEEGDSSSEEEEEKEAPRKKHLAMTRVPNRYPFPGRDKAKKKEKEKEETEDQPEAEDKDEAKEEEEEDSQQSKKTVPIEEAQPKEKAAMDVEAEEKKETQEKPPLPPPQPAPPKIFVGIRTKRKQAEPTTAAADPQAPRTGVPVRHRHAAATDLGPVKDIAKNSKRDIKRPHLTSMMALAGIITKTEDAVDATRDVFLSLLGGALQKAVVLSKYARRKTVTSRDVREATQLALRQSVYS